MYWVECYLRDLKQTPPKLVVVDEKTQDYIKDALNELKLTPTLLCFGDVANAISVYSLLKDDGRGN